ncbi:cytoplasmic dynein 2 heavy chain 1 isoform X2 [Cephus cinctus]|nr:cytoplasmic dynein 2 heavy chain 1 isoform X2 [Cephus cinctus]
MRMTVDQVDTEYGNTKAWKLHWDRQLLKALGVAYRAALPSLLRRMPEIRIELTFRDGFLQWRPSLEEVRAKVYSGLKRFLAIPTNFRGVGDPADGHFSDLVQRSAYLYGGVYKEAEVGLSAIESVRLKWIPLAAPARIDVGERLKGKSPQEWERAFKDAKQWAQEVGKLRGNEVKIWCITIDTATTRNDLESASRRYWERLSADLRTEASSRLVAIMEFLSAAGKELDKRPRTVEEVGIAHEAHDRIQVESAGVANELEAILGLSRVLAAWTRETLEGVSGARAASEGLAERLERHRTVVARQLEDAKVNLRHRGIALRDDRERWETKWSSRPDVMTLEWLSNMRERWTALKEQKRSLDADCKRIGIDLNDIFNDEDSLEKIEAQLDAEESNCRFQFEFLEELKKQEAEEWIVARRRLPRLHDWLDSWETRIQIQLEGSSEKHDKINENENKVQVDTFVSKKIKEVRKAIEWIQLLRGDELADEHWAELKTILNLPIANIRDITLGHLLSKVEIIEENVDRIKEITKRAAAESGIRQAITELESWEGSASLQLQESKDSRNSRIMLVGEYGGLLARAGELRLLLEGAKGAAGYERFAARAARCESALSELEERIKALSTVQRKWVYLDPVYGGGAAPNDSGRWSRADKEFRYLMGEVARDPGLPSLRRLPLPALINLKDLLDRCQRSLDEFLEEKRSSYPRLYFLSDEDLLELVSGSGKGLEAHLPKLYQGVGSVKRENGRLISVISPEGEILKLRSPIDLTESLPQWLKHLEQEIRSTLNEKLEKCLSDSSPDPSQYPAQVLLLSERIHFTERCESAVKEGGSALKKLVESLEAQRARYRGLEDTGEHLIALKARGLLLDTVHHLGVARTLLGMSSNDGKSSWTWSRQLRSYRSDKGPIVKCAGAEFKYKFEYQGAAVGLVRTPLTERCFLALTQAMKLGLGGSPTGPAGTGKTESVKALGAILGRLVLVFNCDEGMDAGSMKRILGGLAQAGAWGCFDEFNRLEEETLSAVAMLVRPLQEAVRDGEIQVQLGNQTVTLDSDCCVFITMNPAGSEYGGRHKLPDSLARLFRPVAMAHPDRSDIVRALLECAGFLEANTLAKQLVETLDISETLLSRQPHYDWGLRALRSVLDAIEPAQLDDSDETKRLLLAIKASTMPKLIESDRIKFLALLSDVFPKVDISLDSVSTKQDLKSILVDLCESKGLKQEVAETCVQLNNQLKSRAGVAIVGPAGSGKTLIRIILTEALSRIGNPVTQILIYPGAMPKTKLLGKVDSTTREWKEGLLSNAVSTAGESTIWIILDGDVEPSWAEALNSALDDNRLLTLPNGVGIKLGSGTRFIFETHKLDGASPATVSRLGVVHLGNLMPKSLILPSRLETLSSLAQDIANTHLSTAADAVLKNNGERSSAAGLIEAALSHLKNSNTRTMGTYALLVSLCGQIEDTNSRDQLARVLYQLTDSWCPDPQRPFAVLYNSETDRIEPFGDPVDILKTENGPLSLSGPVKRALEAVLPWLDSGHPVIVRGPAGCGKSTLISAAILSGKDTNRESSMIVKGSSLYGSQDLILRLKRACVQVDSSSHGRAYRPRNGSRLILILEDLHLASKDLQELVRELLQEGRFHEDDLEYARIPLTAIFTGDTETKLHPRLESLLATHYMPNPSSKESVAIIELHLRNALKGGKIMVESWISRLAPAMLEAFQSVLTSQELITSWTPGDLALWADALKFYPVPEDESEITEYLLDTGRRLFQCRLTIKEQSHWESIIASRAPGGKTSGDDIYAWKGGAAGLLPFGEEQWRKEVENAVAKCAREGEPIQASMSPHLLQIVAGVSWAMGSGQRGMVLVGRPGAGRKSAIRLAATMSSLRLIDSGPGRSRAAIRSAIQASGIDGEPTLLLLEEHHAREVGLAILASAIVSRGEVPGLMATEELDGLIAPLADLARREDFPGSLEQYFYHRLRSLLRVAVILDTADSREDWLLRSGLLKHCVLIGQNPRCEWWSLERPLSELAIQQCGMAEESEEESPGVQALVKTHLRAPSQQQAPARFLALLYSWKQLKEEWFEDIEKKLISLEAGISRLREAGERVSKLENEATKQRQELEAEKGKATAALEQITATMRGATGQRGEMTILKSETERESAELARRKADIEGELCKVEPLVEQAAQAVAGIGTDALAEVRSLRAPPAPVRDVLEGVLRLMGIRDTSWNSMKTFLAKRGVKDEIRSWDARRSSVSSLEAVEKLVKERPESFEEKTARRASVAAAPLAAWVLANLQYGKILQQVAPLEREQRLLAERLAAAEAQLGRLAAGLNSVESRVAQLQEELAAHSRGAAALQLRSEATEASLATARALLHKLDAEHTDWQTQFEELTARKGRLDVEAAAAAALLVYQISVKDDKAKKIAIDLLISERERLQWRAQGLPADTGSLVGASCVLRGPLVPLFLDSSGVAVTWLKSNIGTRLEVTEPQSSRFLTTLELAIRFGKPLLIEELVELPTVLLPLLRQRPLRLGDRTLAPQQGFKLFLATRRDDLDHLPREADSVLMRVTLGAGVRSLAERFVERALQRETPELEAQRREALEREEILSGERDAARLDLLAQLGASRGQDLLQESQGSQGGLLASLEATQLKAKEIALALEESKKSLDQVSRRAKDHEPLAKFAAHLFEAVKSLRYLSPLYVFSAEAFTDIYLEAGDTRNSVYEEKADESRKIMKKKLVTLTLHHCTTAAYRKHRLAVALHLALSLNPVSEVEKRLLFRGAAAYDENSNFRVPSWVPEERSSSVMALGSALPEVASKLKTTWLENIGQIYAESDLTLFQKTLIVKALRPDHLHTAMTKLAAEQLAVRDVAPPSWSLAKIAEDCKTRPILLLLSPGADPASELRAAAAGRTSSSIRFTEISLGQGQVAQAETALESACREGSWLLLSNLQLALNWLPRLEGLLRSPMCTVDKNPTARIWLTTEECSGFYAGLAGLCLKLAYEPPEGVKRNVKRSFQQLQQRQKSSAYPGGNFLLSWLHAILQERRRFVPQGWITAYEWNEADLEAASELVVKELAKENQERDNSGDWDAGRGLLDVAIYGGRLQDAFDMRALQSILKNIWSRDVFSGRVKLGGILRLPEINSENGIKFLEQLKDVDSPKDYFGLPANANRAWERSAAEAAIALLQNLVTGEINTNEAGVRESLKAKIRKELRDLLDQRGSVISSPTQRSESKNDDLLLDFFEDERNLIRRLTSLVRLESESPSITDSKAPRKWLEEWPAGPQEVIPFVNSLLSRQQYLSNLNNIPQEIDLSCLARPRAFLAALKQHTARICKHPLENLQLHANWLEGSKKKEWQCSIIIKGLLISGAEIVAGTLKELDAEAAPVAAAPYCQLAYLPEESLNDKNELNDIHEKHSTDFIQIPVYVDSQRNILICALPVAYSGDDKDVWHRRGVLMQLG